MAIAVYSAQIGKRTNLVIALVFTIVLGLTFLGIKAVEYRAKYEDSLIPGKLIPGRPFNPAVQEHGAAVRPAQAPSCCRVRMSKTSRCFTGFILR